MALCGLGFGFFQAPNNRTLLAAAPRARSGAAGGMFATARLLGQTLGAAGVAILFRAYPAVGLQHHSMVCGGIRAGRRAHQPVAADRYRAAIPDA